MKKILPRFLRFLSVFFSLFFVTACLAACGIFFDSAKDNDTENPTNGLQETGQNPPVSDEKETPAPTEYDPDDFAPTADDLTDGALLSNDAYTASVSFNGATVSGTGTGYTVSGNIVTITAAGTYLLSGNGEGQLKVNAHKAVVRLVLNGVTLLCSDSAPIFVKDAKKVILSVLAGTENSFSDTQNTVLNADQEPTATIFSKDDLTINGSGTLTVSANYNNAIQSKNHLKILDSRMVIRSTDDGIIGKDSLYLQNARLDITAKGDGIASTNTESGFGIAILSGGEYNLACGGDGIVGKNNLEIIDGVFSIITGGGSQYTSYTKSAKGLKAGGGLTVRGGSLTLDTADDCIHSNNSVVIEGGSFSISSGDDGIHADTTVKITDGKINITKSYEGVEATEILVLGGTLDIVASDDGINVSGGADGSAIGRPGGGGFGGGSNSNNKAVFSGGVITINAAGDGLDSNGNIEMSGGSIFINGPTSNNNGAIDYDGTFTMSGGTIFAIGASGMAQTPSSSNVYGMNVSIRTNGTAGLLTVKDDKGTEITRITAVKTFSSLVLFSEKLTPGTYSIFRDNVLIATASINGYTTGNSGGNRPR